MHRAVVYSTVDKRPRCIIVGQSASYSSSLFPYPYPNNKKVNVNTTTYDIGKKKQYKVSV